MLTESISRAALLAEATASFADRFGGPARWIVAAPGRVNLIGDHTDYSGGLAMPLAIERYTMLCAGPAEDSICAVSASEGAGRPIDIDTDPIENSDDWTRYLRGVAQGFRAAGVPVAPMNLYCHSNVPTGAGLSSSAALEVACGRLLEVAAGVGHDPERMVRICRRAEHEYAGVPCGYLDQFSITYAKAEHVMLFDSDTLTAEQIPYALPGAELMILDSRVKHALGLSEYPVRRAECRAAISALGRELRDAPPALLDEKLGSSNPLLHRRARHIVSENARVRRMATAIARKDLDAAGDLMYESHHSLAQDYEISCQEIDLIVNLLRDDPAQQVFGARMTGGGFGGAVIALTKTGAAAEIANRLAPAYRRRTGLDLACMTVSPQQGIQVIKGNPTDV